MKRADAGEPAPRGAPAANASAKPPFTRSRLALCADAEAAVAKAQAITGHLIAAREARRYWIKIQSDCPVAPAAERWRWMLEPAVCAGRVVQQVEKGLALYGIAQDESSACLPPAGRQYGPRLLDVSRQAEEALLQAMQIKGAMVLPAEISSAWMTLFAKHSAPPSSGEGWSKTLAPAVQAGRVITERRGNDLYFGLKDDPACTLPPPPLPKWTRRKLEDCERAEQAVESAVALTGAMASTREICDAWERLFTEPPPPQVRKQIYKALEPAVLLGRVRVASRITRGYLFAPMARIDVPPPAYVSDLERVEEAVRRAVTRMGSAVLMEEIAAEVALDSELMLQTQLTLTHQLQSLTDCGRVAAIRSRRRQGRCRKYYSTAWGPRWVLASAEHHLDRRMRAARALWKASRGHAFTTTALREFANARPSYCTEGDPPYAWTNALQYLHEDGQLVRIASEDSYHVRWAPADKWNALAPADQERALRDASRCPPAEVSEPGNDGDDLVNRSPLDVGFASHAQDMRTLVLLAKAHALAAETDPGRRQILRSRPVTLKEVKQAAESRPQLVPRTEVPLRVYLQDAARTRNGQRHGPVTWLGVVRNRAFYDVRITPAAEAYVAYRLALRDAAPAPLRRSVVMLRDAIELHTSGVIPLTDEILNRRVEAMLEKIRDRRTHLTQACDAAALLSEEETQAEQVESRLMKLEKITLRLRTRPSISARPVEPPDALDVLEAWKSLDGLYTMAEGVAPRMLAARFAVPVIRGPVCRQRGRRGGRPVELRMERIEFVRYAHARFGNARSGHFVAQGCHALGDLRSPTAFIAALRDGGRPSAHALAAAALGLLDDPSSRDALADYVIRAVAGSDEYSAPGTTLPGCEAAVHGLAPSPFGGLARELREHEHQALVLAASSRVEDQLRALAQRVLLAWDEGWDRDRLLQL